MSLMKPLLRKIVAALIVLALLAVAGPWVYINLIKEDAPDALSLEPAVTTTAGEVQQPTNATDGEWAVVADSVVGYRVKEILFGQDTEGVGRTSAVAGSLVIANNEVTSAEFSVDMTTIKSDSSRRDRQVNNRILDTATFPTATFALSDPIALTPEALAGSDFTANTTGTLTLRGVTKTVPVALTARLVDNVIEVNGNIEIVFAEWQIPDPSVSAIVVEDRGLLEFLIRFSR
jgi:polyisoprenoid-binding protein YceI